MILINQFVYTPYKKELKQKQTTLLKDFVNRNVEELSIVLHVNSQYSYLKIKDKEIIKEIMDALGSDSVIQPQQTGQYNSEYVMTLHDKNSSDLMKLSSETFNKNVKSNSVKVTLFEVKNIDIFDLYYKSIMECEDFFTLFMRYFGYGEYYYENYKLYDIINKYIKGKGIEYNKSTLPHPRLYFNKPSRATLPCH